MIISDNSVVIMINEINANDNAKISRIKLKDMFGSKKFKDPNMYFEIWNDSIPSGAYSKHYRFDRGISKEFARRMYSIEFAKYIGELVVNGTELYCAICNNKELLTKDLMTFEEAVKACFEDPCFKD